MGDICSKPSEGRPPQVLTKKQLSKEGDLIFSPSSFVKENTHSFFINYKLDDRPLGAGAWGEVRKCTYKVINEVRVVKIISKSNLPESVIRSRSVFNEANLLRTLDHPNLPKIFEFFEDDSNYYIVLEYIKGGDLFDRIIELKKFSENQAAFIMSQILLAVNYLHSNGIVHRDIKPENILMSDKETLCLKLVDFDTATQYKTAKFRQILGTPLYMAPDIIRGNYDEKCDLWSCGIILYILITGHPPYDGTEEEMIKILKNPKITYKDKVWSTVTDNLNDFIQKLLQVDPKKRISSSEACNHPWLANLRESVSDLELRGVLENIVNFRKESKLKEAVHTFIISKIIDQDLYRTEQAVFHMLDYNRDGKISKEEFLNLMISRGINQEEAQMYAEMAMERADSDKSGFIDYTEFMRASVARSQVLTRANIEQAFKIFDEDSSGTIEMEELRRWLTNDNSTTESLVKEIIEQVDKNGDGKIDLEEFEYLLVEGIKRRSITSSLPPVIINLS